MPTRARVLFVDDDPHVRRALPRALSEVGDLVTVGTIAEAERVLGEHWDGFILDESLPDGKGTDLARQIRAERPDVPIVLFTALDPDELLPAANSEGVVYAHKVDGLALLRNQVTLWARAAGAQVTTPLERLEELAAAADLSAREIEVGRLLLEGRSREGMARELGVSPKTVAGHVGKLLEKTGFERASLFVAHLNRWRE